MKNLFFICLSLCLYSCAEVENDQRYQVQAKLLSSSNQRISDASMATIRGDNFLNSRVLLGSGVSDIDGDVEFVSLVPTGSYLNLSINPQLRNLDLNHLPEFPTVNLRIDQELIESNRMLDLGFIRLAPLLDFQFKIVKTSTTPALLNWELTYESSSFCIFTIASSKDFNQNFSCQRTQSISQINDANNPNENLNLSVNEETIVTFKYSINGQDHQIIEITPNTDENEFEFNY